MTDTLQLTAAQLRLVRASARLRAFADSLAESEVHLLAHLESELRKLSSELWELADEVQ